MTDRYRKKNLLIPVTDLEKEAIKKRMDYSHYTSISKYMRDMAINGFIFKIDYEPIRKLTHEIGKIGVNINQIAHKINGTGQVSHEELEELKEMMAIIWQYQKSILSEEP